MKIPFTFFVLFATHIIPLIAEIYGKKNALVPGSLRPHLKFWRNPFSSSKAEPENEKEPITGTFRVQGTATLKNGKIELDISLANEIAPETGLMPPASGTTTGPTTGSTIKPTSSEPTSASVTPPVAGGSTSASVTPPPAGGSTSPSVTPPPAGGSTSPSVTPPPAGGSTSPSVTPPAAGGSTSPSVTPPAAGGSTSPSVTPPPAGGSTSPSVTPPPAGGSASPSVTPPPAGGSTSPSVTPPPAGGSASPSVTPPPAGGSTSPSVTPPPAGGSTSPSVTPPPAGGSTSPSVTPPPAGGSTSPNVTPPPAGGSTSPSVTPPPAGGSTSPSVTPPAAGGSTPTSTTGPGSSTRPASTPTSPVMVTAASSATPPTSATRKPTVPVKICITPGQVYVVIVAKGVMAAHNSVRRTHSSPALQLDEQMTCDAQLFAEQMASRGVLEHQKSSILARKRVGENIGMSCTPARNGPLSFQKIKKMVGNVAKRWYDEVCDYNFDKPSFAPRVGHFTEVVWSNSRKLGVGYAVGRNAKFPGYACVYVVGRYRPAGNNMESQRLETNVKRGNFNYAYCTKRSKAPAFTLIPVDKRNQLKASHRARP